MKIKEYKDDDVLWTAFFQFTSQPLNLLLGSGNKLIAINLFKIAIVIVGYFNLFWVKNTNKTYTYENIITYIYKHFTNGFVASNEMLSRYRV